MVNESQNSLLDKSYSFHDGKAAYRLEKLFQNFIFYADSGLNKKETLAKPCCSYRKDNGEQSVINLFEEKSNLINEDNI